MILSPTWVLRTKVTQRTQNSLVLTMSLGLMLISIPAGGSVTGLVAADPVW